MAVEPAQYISDLNASYPDAFSGKAGEGDDHIRMIKDVLLRTFPNADQEFDLKALAGLAGVPSGTIVMWHGEIADIPVGWNLCDGSNGTPDLRDRFVYGAGGDKNPGDTFGTADASLTVSSAGGHTHTGSSTSAGSHSHNVQAHALSIGEMPAHNHGGGSHSHGGITRDSSNDPYVVYSTGSTGTDFHQEDNSGTIINTEGGNMGHSHGMDSAGSHTHTMNLDEAGDHTHTITGDVSPPAYALAYIMKV